jgi:hypothetical protein
MDRDAALRIVNELSPEAVVIDVGGGASPFARANYVIDALPFDERAGLGAHDLGIPPQYSRERWVEFDLCSKSPWPFADNQFDFATCSHLLEDVRDPVWICSELSRIAKAGYIEVPSRVLEQSLGVEHPSYSGFYHHRWLVSVNDGVLEFRHKPHLLHSTRRAIVAQVGILRRINPKHAITTLWWNGAIECREVLEFSEARAVEELCSFAARARQTPQLTVASGLSTKETLRRALFYTRLRAGYR